MIQVRTIRLSLAASFLFNLAAAALLLLDDSPLAQLAGITPSASAVHSALAALLVAALGVAYGWLALQSRIDRTLLAYGAWVKAVAFCTFVILALLGITAARFALFAFPDILFATLWFLWLRQPQGGNHA